MTVEWEQTGTDEEYNSDDDNDKGDINDLDGNVDCNRNDNEDDGSNKEESNGLCIVPDGEEPEGEEQEQECDFSVDICERVDSEDVAGLIARRIYPAAAH